MNEKVFSTDHVTNHARGLWTQPIVKAAVLEGLAVCPNGLELGTYEGRSALWFTEHFLGNGSLDCVDTWENAAVQSRFLSNCKAEIESGKICAYRTTTEEFLSKNLAARPQPTYGFIYVDANTDSRDLLFDLVCCFKSLAVKGVMIMDDYLWGVRDRETDCFYLKPKLAIDSFLQVYKANLDILHKGFQVVVQKTA